VWSEAAKPLGPIAYILKARTTLLRDLAQPWSPFNAFLTLQGVETLPLRIERHSSTPPRFAAWLAKQSAVTSVIHPSVQKGEAKKRAEQIPQGRLGRSGSGFEIKGGRDAGRKFIDALQLLLSRRQYRRCALARHPSGDHHPLAAHARGAESHRRNGRLRPAVDRDRAYRRQFSADLDQG